MLIIYICDRIWENVHSSHIRFCSCGDPQKPQKIVYRFKTFQNDKGIVVLQSLKVSYLTFIPNRFYESPKLKNWMCELCTFSQIRSHMYKYQVYYVHLTMNFYYCDHATMWLHTGACTIKCTTIIIHQ